MAGPNQRPFVTKKGEQGPTLDARFLWCQSVYWRHVHSHANARAVKSKSSEMSITRKHSFLHFSRKPCLFPSITFPFQDDGYSAKTRCSCRSPPSGCSGGWLFLSTYIRKSRRFSGEDVLHYSTCWGHWKAEEHRARPGCVTWAAVPSHKGTWKPYHTVDSLALAFACRFASLDAKTTKELES